MEVYPGIFTICLDVGGRKVDVELDVVCKVLSGKEGILKEMVKEQLEQYRRGVSKIPNIEREIRTLEVVLASLDDDGVNLDGFKEYLLRKKKLKKTSVNVILSVLRRMVENGVDIRKCNLDGMNPLEKYVIRRYREYISQGK
jgi:hypothetical protein